MSKIKKVFRNSRVIVLLIVLLFAIVSINPKISNEGAAIRQVVKDSAADLAGIANPKPNIAPTSREKILGINGQPVNSVLDFYKLTSDLPPNKTITIKTNKGFYRLITKAATVFDNSSNSSFINGTEDIGLVVFEPPTSNIGKGLDLSGGTRVVLQPEHKVSPEDLSLIIDNIKQRLNVFGLSDITVRTAKDLSGNDFIVVEVPGINAAEVRELLGSQGVFEAKIENKTVFRGGDDITFVCRSSSCSGIDSRRGGCQPSTNGGWVCPFSFSIKLSDDAARRQAEATKELSVVQDQGGAYLSEPIELYLDGELVDKLNIAAELQGRAVTDIQISGSGTGADRQEALQNAITNMKKLQTILVTGSLPVSLNIVKTDSISPALGEEFVKNAFVMGLVAILAVALVVFIRYRRLVISLPMILTMISEAIIILGVAALIGWNMDLASIAGIIIAVGTGVDDQIVIVDETMRGEEMARTWKERLKRAFFIIFASYATTVVAMVPLWFAGAGLLRGFAITTIIGVSIGVFVTRPAFAAMIEIFLKD